MKYQSKHLNTETVPEAAVPNIAEESPDQTPNPEGSRSEEGKLLLDQSKE